MRNLCCFILLLLCAAVGCAQSNSYLFVWAGDDAKKSNDFLAVLDADPKSPHYGQVVASAAVPSPNADTTVVNLDAHTKFTPFEEMIIEDVLDLSAKGDYANWAHLLLGEPSLYWFLVQPEIAKFTLNIDGSICD